MRLIVAAPASPIIMILNKVSARNLKGTSFEHRLGPAVAIQGPNFSGKTAIFEAIRLAMLGHIPEIGKLPKATWELSSGQSMEVCVWFDDGTQIKRDFRDGKSGVSIGSERFVDSLADSPLLDAEHYFELKDTERTNYVFRHVRLPAVYTPESIIAQLERISFEENHSESVEKGKAALIKACRGYFVDTELQDALGNLVDYLGEQFSYWNRRAKETHGAVTTLTELKLRSEDETLAAPADIEEQIGSLQQELDGINTEKGALTANRDSLERNAGRRTMLQKELDKDRIDYARMIEQKRTEKNALQWDPEPKPEEIEEARRTIANANSTIRGADNAVSVADTDIGEVDKRLHEIEFLEACPYCKAKGTGWKKTLKAELNERKTKAEEAIKTATRLREKAAGELRDADETLEGLLASQQRNARLRNVAENLDADIAKLEASQKGENEKRQRYEAEIAELPKGGDLKAMGRSIEALEQRRLKAATKLSGLNSRKTEETKMKQDLRRAEESAVEHRTAADHVLVIKAFGKVLKEKREGLIAEAFTSLLKVANMFAKSILKSPLVLVNNTIGRMVGEKFVTHRTFTGAEKALTYIAIATALSSQAPIRLVLLDELGRLDAAVEDKVINRLAHLVNEGVIDQFLVATPRALPAAARKVVQLIEVNG